MTTCSNLNATLVEPRTPEEGAVVKRLRGKILSSVNGNKPQQTTQMNYSYPLADFTGTNFWTGLVNPDLVHCRNDECLGRVFWHSDGSPVDVHGFDSVIFDNVALDRFKTL